MKRLEHMFKALADPTRLRIVNLLLRRELCVCDMQAILGLSQPLLSRHLAYLRHAGMVQDRREGTRVFYSLTLDDDVGRALRKFLRTVFPLFDVLRKDVTRMKKSTAPPSRRSALRSPTSLVRQ
ncbi:MAG: ArsR family transcriptional regulator [Acidobacteria bacterium]|nr:MAG: ArsR family transcriptional regulator [Acidobacteriota bacterium]